MTDDQIAIGIVGTGSRARTLLESFYAIRDQYYLLGNPGDPSPTGRVYQEFAATVPQWAEDISDLRPRITALFDPDTEQLAQTTAVCRDHGDDPESVDSFEAFLDCDHDAVLLSSPNHLHVEQLPPLLDRDLHVLCEKPVANTLEDHDFLIEEARRSEGEVYPAFTLRTSPYFAMLRELVDDNTVGDLGMISCYEVRQPFQYGDWMYDGARTGGSLLTKNCHDFDLFNWYADANPVEVFAYGGQHVLSEKTDILDQATVVVKYENGTLGTLELCMYAPWGVRTRRYELRGAGGLLRSPEDATTIERFTRRGRDRYEVETVGQHQGGDLLQVKRFLRCVQGREEPALTLIDAKKAAAVPIAAQVAIAEGRPVGIDENYDLLD